MPSASHSNKCKKFERSANRISASRLFEISQVLDVPVSFFFDDMPEEIAGRPAAGKPDLDIFGSPEAAELLRAYYRISSRAIQLSFKDLAKAIARNG